MKKRSLITSFVLLLVVAFLFGLCACGANYSDEDNFKIWAAARENCNNYSENSPYTVVFESKKYEDGEKFVGKTLETEALHGRKYFHTIKESQVDENNGLKDVSNYLEIVKLVDDEGVTKTKYLECDMFSSENEGKYVNANYGKWQAQYQPSTIFLKMGYGKGATFEEFKDAIINVLTTDKTTEALSYSFSTSRNKNGEVSLIIESTTKTKFNDFDDDETYLYTQTYDKTTITTNETQLVSIFSTTQNNHKFQNKKDSVVKTEDTVTYSYTFDDGYYDSLSMYSDTTTDDLYGYVTFKLNGVGMVDVLETDLNKNITNESLKDFLKTREFVKPAIQSDAVYEIYTDEAMTQVFENQILEDDGIQLYIKLIVPEDSALVVETEVDYERISVYTIRVVKLGQTYDFETNLDHATILSIDGVKTEEGQTGFVCSESKVYVLCYEY